MSIQKNTCTQCSGKICEQDLRSHPVLGVTICSACHQSYLQTGDLSMYRDGVDKDGVDNYCRWCLDGGDMTLCADERCRNGFCENCIGRNLGDAKKNQIRSSEDWYCFMCNQIQLDKIRVPVKKPPETTSRPMSSAKPPPETPAKQASLAKPPSETNIKQVDSVRPFPGTPAKLAHSGKDPLETPAKPVTPAKPTSATPAKPVTSAKPTSATPAKPVTSAKPAKPTSVTPAKPVAPVTPAKPTSVTPAKPVAPAKPTSEAIVKQVPPPKPQSEAVTKQVLSNKPQPEAAAEQVILVKSQSDTPVKQILSAKSSQEVVAKQLPSDKPQSELSAEQMPPAKPQTEAATKQVPSNKPNPETSAKQVSSAKPQLEVATEQVHNDRSQPDTAVGQVAPVKPQKETNTIRPAAAKIASKTGVKRPYIDFQLFSSSKLFQRPKILKTSVEPTKSAAVSSPQTTSVESPAIQAKSSSTPAKLTGAAKITTNSSTRVTVSVNSTAPNTKSTATDSSTKTTLPALKTTLSSGSKSDAIDLAAIQKELDLSDNDSDDFMEASEVFHPGTHSDEMDVSEAGKSATPSKEAANSSSQVKGTLSTLTNSIDAVISAHEATASSTVQDMEILQALEALASKTDEKLPETDVMTKWMMRDARVIRGRLNDLTKSLILSLSSYDETRFRAEPSQLLSWKNNLITFLEQTPPTLITRCKHLDNYLPSIKDRNTMK